TAIPQVLRAEEAIGLGALFVARGPIEAPQEALIVSLSVESAEALGLDRNVGRWPRARHAELIERLAAAGPAAIAMDIMFEEERRDDPDGRSEERRVGKECGSGWRARTCRAS